MKQTPTVTQQLTRDPATGNQHCLMSDGNVWFCSAYGLAPLSNEGPLSDFTERFQTGRFAPRIKLLPGVSLPAIA